MQIYRELAELTDGNFTTSFIRRDQDVKDNRLLPLGWTRKTKPSLNGRFLHATYPHGNAKDDPDYKGGKGLNHVQCRIELHADVDTANVDVSGVGVLPTSRRTASTSASAVGEGAPATDISSPRT